MKKLFLVSLALLVLVLVFWGLYVFVYKNNSYTSSVNQGKTGDLADGKTPTSQTTQTKPAVPGIFSDASVQKVIDEPLVGAITDPADDYLWYVTDTKPATIKKKTLLSGGVETVATLPYGVAQARWSPDLTGALVQEVTTEGERWHLVHLQDGSDVPLKNGLQSPIWTNAGDRIIYVYASPDGKRSLNLSRPDGSDWKQLASLSLTGGIALAAFPQSALIAVWNIPSAFDMTSFQTVSVGGGDPQTLLASRFGADYIFSPDGSKIFTVSSDRKGGHTMVAGVTNALGGEYRALDVPTFINKAVWSKDTTTLYYALPNALPDGAVVPDDYRRKSIFTQDTFWKIDTTTGKKSRLVELSDIPEAFDATKVFLDHQERSFFFIDRRSRVLYRVKL